MDRGPRQATVHGVEELDVTEHTHTDYLEHLLQFLGPKETPVECANKWMDISL